MTTITPLPCHASAVDSAKLLRATLRDRFPATTFSVRIGRGTAYGNCYIHWTDGPSVDLVQTVTAQFEGHGFDGMTDSTIVKKAIMPDGRRSGLGLILEERTISKTFAERIAEALNRKFGLDIQVIGRDGFRDGWYVAKPYEAVAMFSNGGNTYQQDLIWRASSDRTFAAIA